MKRGKKVFQLSIIAALIFIATFTHTNDTYNYGIVPDVLQNPGKFGFEAIIYS